MKLLEQERRVLAAFAPGLDEQLKEVGTACLEDQNSPAISLFKTARAGRLLVPKEVGGAGASALEALRFHIALGSRAPSLAVATTMHQYKVATLAKMDERDGMSSILRRFAKGDWLVASGGAEGIPGKSLFAPTVTSMDTERGIVVTGTKKPCCLTWSMDVLSVMIASSQESRYGGELLNVLIDARHSSIKRTRFWNSPVLRAAESDAVTLQDTPVEADHVFRLGTPDDAKPFTVVALVWFELLASGSYLGMTLRLVEMLLEQGKGSAEQRASIAVRLEPLLASLEHVAEQVDADRMNEALLARIIKVRYAVQDFIKNVGAECIELLGGLSFATSTEGTTFLLSSRALSFHPPSQVPMHVPLAEHFAGASFRLA
jgi:alkylation response protein AidB-like acyl-CoA dehydrogenase